MASETLAVSEQYLLEFIKIVRDGIRAQKLVSPTLKAQLTRWCDEEEEYINS